MPNKLDFDVVFTELTRIHETGNVAVLSTIIAALLVYFLVCIFARKADKKDRAQVRISLALFRIVRSVFTHETSSHIGLLKQKKVFAYS